MDYIFDLEGALTRRKSYKAAHRILQFKKLFAYDNQKAQRNWIKEDRTAHGNRCDTIMERLYVEDKISKILKKSPSQSLTKTQGCKLESLRTEVKLLKKKYWKNAFRKMILL